MEDLRQLLESGKFIRIDAEGEHIEAMTEFVKNTPEQMLALLNRVPEDLVSLYQKTENKKLINDIALASLFSYVNHSYNAMLSDIAEAQNQYDILRHEYDSLLKDYNNTKEALANAEKMVESLNSNVTERPETAAVKKPNISMRRMGDEHISGINIGV